MITAIFGGLLAIWLVGLGLSLVVGQKAGARWFMGATRAFGGNGIRLAWQLLTWFARTVLVGIGWGAVAMVTRLHNFFFTRWPNGTLAVYGAAIIGLLFRAFVIVWTRQP